MAWSRGRRNLATAAAFAATTVAVAIVVRILAPTGRAVVVVVATAAIGVLVGALYGPVASLRRRIRRRSRMRAGLPVEAEDDRREYLVPRELPPPPAMFVGRETMLDEVATLLTAKRPNVGREGPLVVVVYGEPGIGKSAFAIKTATSVIKHFTDGVIFASLTGATRSSPRLRNVLGDLVDSLQGPGDKVPTKYEERQAEFRRLTRDKRHVLYVFDDVLSADVVTDIMPAGSAAVVLVTSRQMLRFPGLRASVVWRRLAALNADESLLLLRLLLGERSSDEVGDDALRPVATSAAGYPLALHLAARAISNRGTWALAEIAASLPAQAPKNVEQARTRMLDLSVALLDDEQRRTLLSLHLLEDQTFAPWVTQALANLDTEDDAWIICERLADLRLLERVSPDATGVVMLRIPDRVRAYIETKANEVDADVWQKARLRLEEARTERSRRDISRLLDGEIDRSLVAGDVTGALNKARGALADARERDPSTSSGGIPGRDERRALVILAEVLAELGGLDDAWEIANTDRHARTQTGHDPAEPEDITTVRVGRILGRLRRRQWRLGEAVAELSRAHEIAERLGDVAGQVLTLRELALTQSMRTDVPDNPIRGAYNTLEKASALVDPVRQSPHDVLLRCRLREANAVVRLNDVEYQGGDPRRLDEARAELERAIADLQRLEQQDRELPDKTRHYRLWHAWFAFHQAQVLHQQAAPKGQLAEGRQARRRLAEARGLAVRALDAFSAMRHKYGAARCRLEIGRTYAHDRPEAALPMLEEARETFLFCGDRWIEAKTALALARVRLLIVGREPSHSDREDARAELLFAARVFEILGDRRSLQDVQAAQKEQRNQAGARARATR